MSDIEKATVFYEYLGLYVTYDHAVLSVGSDYGNYRCFTSYGALIDGVAVCDGYASAYRLMCLIEGIPCVEVIGTSNGTGHAWNKVFIGGVWYAVDSTWSRVGTDYITHRYLLISEEELILTGHVENDFDGYESYTQYVASNEQDYYDMTGEVLTDASQIKKLVNQAAAEGITLIELKNLSGKSLSELFSGYNLRDFNVKSLSYASINGTNIIYIILVLK